MCSELSEDDLLMRNIKDRYLGNVIEWYKEEADQKVEYYTQEETDHFLLLMRWIPWTAFDATQEGALKSAQRLGV